MIGHWDLCWGLATASSPSCSLSSPFTGESAPSLAKVEIILESSRFLRGLWLQKVCSKLCHQESGQSATILVWLSQPQDVCNGGCWHRVAQLSVKLRVPLLRRGRRVDHPKEFLINTKSNFDHAKARLEPIKRYPSQVCLTLTPSSLYLMDRSMNQGLTSLSSGSVNEDAASNSLSKRED